MSPSEQSTRKNLIDPKIKLAGWKLEDKNQVGFEIPVDGYDAEPWNGVTDYCLYLPNGEVIAVVEAKRQSRSPEVAEQQVRHYVTEIAKHQSFQPFSFMTNGDRTFFWDVDRENKRQVAGFFSLRDLQNLLYLRQHKVPLQQVQKNVAIAGRLYQQEAVQRVSERFDDGHRRALMVMATGTGKTRIMMSLVDLFSKLKVTSLLAFLRVLLEFEALPDYKDIVERNFEQFITQHRYNASQIRFLRAVQSVFLQKRRLEFADLYDEPLDRFGENAVGRWFTENEVNELIYFTEQFAA